jgi:hypothetical protein
MTYTELKEVCKDYNVDLVGAYLCKDGECIGTMYCIGDNYKVFKEYETYHNRNELVQAILKYMFTRKHYIMRKKLEKIKEDFV